MASRWMMRRPCLPVKSAHTSIQNSFPSLVTFSVSSPLLLHTIVPPSFWTAFSKLRAIWSSLGFAVRSLFG